ncbi:hypothetical protein Tco_0803666 [Tanacetum coccineum]|uniref:Uncharacterized protein n=1 Tax=Tanacetum coccineum TaxID=301880 RepID=A0ABQ5A6J6_9ASTR
MSIALTASFAATKYIIRVSPFFGVVRVGYSDTNFFISRTAASVAFVHLKSFFLVHFFNISKKGRDHLADLDKKRLRAARFPHRDCICLRVLGEGMSMTAFVFSGLAFIPSEVTMYPKNFPSCIPNEHFFGLSFMFILRRVEKVCSISFMMSCSVILLITISSTYASRKLPLPYGKPSSLCPSLSSVFGGIPYKHPRNTYIGIPSTTQSSNRSPAKDMEDDVDISALTMEKYIALIPDDIKPGIVNPKIGDDVEFEINANFMRELRRKLFAGTDDEDAYEHVRTVLEIVDLFHFPGVIHDAIMLRYF